MGFAMGSGSRVMRRFVLGLTSASLLCGGSSRAGGTGGHEQGCHASFCAVVFGLRLRPAEPEELPPQGREGVTGKIQDWVDRMLESDAVEKSAFGKFTGWVDRMLESDALDDAGAGSGSAQRTRDSPRRDDEDSGPIADVRPRVAASWQAPDSTPRTFGRRGAGARGGVSGRSTSSGVAARSRTDWIDVSSFEPRGVNPEVKLRFSTDRPRLFCEALGDNTIGLSYLLRCI